MVQITLRLHGEHGREYTSIIKSGTIIRERDVTSSRAVDLTSRIYPYRHYFGLLREDMLLRTVGGNYGIPHEPYQVNLPRILHVPEFRLDKLNLLERIKNYLKKKRHKEQEELPFYKKIIRRIPSEMMDISIGGVLFWAYIMQYISIQELAGFSGFLGIASGAFDWVWRQRNPFLPKVIMLLGMSSLAILYEIQYRSWSIFLTP